MEVWIIIVAVFISFIMGIMFDRYLCKKAIRKMKKEKDKYFAFFFVLEQWLSNKQNRLRIEDYLINNGYKSVAIYGMGVLGNLLYNELKNTSINVLYGIDKYADNMYFDLPVIKDARLGDKVDVIIVTAIGDYEDVAEKLREGEKDINIISLENIIYNVAEC